MHKITITYPSDTGQRIDRFCKKYLPNAPLGAIYKMLRTGKIKVNTKKKDQTYRICLGDEISFWFSHEEFHTLREDQIPDIYTIHCNPDVSKVSLNILYEDEYLIVINKPAGLNVHAGDHKTNESNLIDLVQDYLGSSYDSLTFRPALVHRIDRDTSGCIMIAKEKKTLELLLASLQSHQIEKVYHALVFGIPSIDHTTISARLEKIENPKDTTKVRVVSTGGQTAVTHYQRIGNPISLLQNNIDGDNGIQYVSQICISLLECRIETGRTHQIRVHLAHIGCPIVGDKMYGNKSYNAYLSRRKGIQRQMLHARELIFTHPISRKNLHIIAPYYDDFASLLD